MKSTVISFPAAPVAADIPDSELIARCRRGETAAEDQLVRRYLGLVYSAVYGWVHQTEWAEDLTQETFLRAMKALDRFDTRRPFKPWLLTIAANVAKTALKKHQRAPHLSADPDVMLATLADATPGPEAMVDEAQPHPKLEEALNSLPPAMRQALLLRHVYDLSYEEVAEVLDAKLNTVRTWLRRGRESLKTALETAGGFDA